MMEVEMQPLLAARAAILVAASLAALALADGPGHSIVTRPVAPGPAAAGSSLSDIGPSHGDFRGRGRGSWFGFGLGDGGAYVPDRRSGFFDARSGPRTWSVRGRVAYDYDRGYPYDHYDGQYADDARAAPPPRCETQFGWDARERRDVPVRICRR